MKAKPFTEQLRRAIDASGKSQYRIGLETGISHSVLSRFMRGERGMSLTAIDKVCEYLGARLVTGQEEGTSTKRPRRSRRKER